VHADVKLAYIHASIFAKSNLFCLLTILLLLRVAEIIKEVAQEVHRAVKTGVVSVFLQRYPATPFHAATVNTVSPISKIKNTPF
jgi:hypothetical protein